jgi:hypothetical protein
MKIFKKNYGPLPLARYLYTCCPLLTTGRWKYDFEHDIFNENSLKLAPQAE